MSALHRVRSQHFVSSPRKPAAPAKHKLTRHSSKRRRLGSSAFAPLPSNNVSSDEDEAFDQSPSRPTAGRTSVSLDTDPLSLPGPSRSRSREIAEVTAKRSKSRSKWKGTTTRHSAGKKDLNGHASAHGHGQGDVFSMSDENEDSVSPKKRKRRVGSGYGHSRESRSEGSSSWVEMEDDGEEEEEKPEFIAESDQHLLQDAPAYALHRLRKAELVRLWKVAGMWSIDDGEDSVASTVGDDDDGGLMKKDLVDGLIAARRTSVDRHVSIKEPLSPRGLKALGDSYEFKRLRSASSSFPLSTTASSDGDNGSNRRRRPVDTDATPKAAGRTRPKRRSETTLLRSVHKRPNGTRVKGKGKETALRTRSKSFGAEKDERKARFGEEVKSPGKALIGRRSRRNSTQSSAYTTTDTSPPRNPAPSRRRRSGTSRNHTPARDRRASGTRSANVAPSDVTVLSSSEDESGDEANPTPLVHRLRSRTSRNSLVKQASSDIDADGEEESELDDQGQSSPQMRRRESRANPKSNTSDMSMRQASSQQSQPGGKTLPDRGAKRKAIQALKGGESDTEDDDAKMLDGDEEMVSAEEDEGVRGDGDHEEEEEEDGDGPRFGPRTRSQLRARDETASQRTVVMESDEDDDARGREDTSHSPLSPTPGPDRMDIEETPAPEHRTRSGKAFGKWQTRRNRLRQEAIDDPDMEALQEEVDDEEETEDEEEDEAFETDVDLRDATQASLVRLLRDELVQLCEARGIEVGGTKPQLAKALLEWRDEQNDENADQKSTTSSQATARPRSSKSNTSNGSDKKSKTSRAKIIHAIGTPHHAPGKATPVLLRDHIHATDPATPPHSNESKGRGEAELNLDLSELGLEDSMINPSQLHKLEKIGSGGFKDVYVGKLRGRKVAISEFREELSEMDIRELKLLAEFSHPNIVKFRGICIPEDNSQVPCMLVSELCENGDLFDYIRNVPCPPLKRVLGLMLDIARGLEYLHTRQPAIIHRDCKSSNILINRAGVAKVGDFGLARVKHSTRSMIRSLVGTVNWQAPELWHPTPRYDYKVDVFSAAVVYWEMMSNWIGEKKYPWEGHNEHYIYDAVGAKQRRPSIVGLKKHWGAEPVNLMERMWHQDPGERPTMTDVVADLEVLIAECK